MADIAFTKAAIVPQQVGMKAVDSYVSETIALTAAGGETPNKQGDISIEGYDLFVVEFDHDISGSDSENVKLEIFGSLLGTVFGTVALATLAFTSTGVAHAVVQGAFSKLRLKVTNADAGNADNSVVRVTMRR